MFSSVLYTQNLPQIPPSTSSLLFGYETIQTNEYNLIEDLLYVLQGIESILFIKVNGKFQLDDRVQVKMNHLSVQAVEGRIREYLDVANSVQYLRDSVGKINLYENPLLRNVGEGIIEYISQFTTKITSIILQLNQQSQYNHQNSNGSQKITLLYLSLIFSNDFVQIGKITNMVRFYFVVDKPQIAQQGEIVKGLLDYFCIQCGQIYCFGGTVAEQSKSVILRLFRQLLKGYLEILKYFIRNEMKEYESTLTICPFFINKDREVIRDRVPAIIGNLAAEILLLGNMIQFISMFFNEEERFLISIYLNFKEIFCGLDEFVDQLCPEASRFFVKEKKSCFMSVSQRMALKKKVGRKIEVMEYEDQGNPFKMRAETKGNFMLRPEQDEKQTHIPQKPKKSNPSQQNQTQISLTHKFTTHLTSLLTTLTKKYLLFLTPQPKQLPSQLQLISNLTRIRKSIDNTLDGIKKYMLIGQGNFIQQFVELSFMLLERSQKKVDSNRVKGFIEEALKTCGKDIVGQDFVVEAQFLRVREFEKEGMERGWRVISVICRPNQPINCIFSAPLIQTFCYINNFLINLKRCEYILTSLWSNLIKQNKSSNSLLLKLRNCLHHYTTTLLTYILIQIQQKYTNLLSSLTTQDLTIPSIIQTITDFSQEISQLTISNKPISNILAFLIKMSDKMGQFGRRIQKKLVVQRQQIEDVGKWFVGVVQVGRSVQGFGEMIEVDVRRFM